MMATVDIIHPPLCHVPCPEHATLLQGEQEKGTGEESEWVRDFYWGGGGGATLPQSSFALLLKLDLGHD
jgi:hypothetical protein